MIDPWPLVGRDPELAYVLERLGGPVAAGVVIAGESGVGKTRLAAEVRQRLEHAGIASVRVAATRAAASIPFGALAPLLPRVVDRPDDLLDLFTGAATALAELAAPLPGPRGRPGAGPPRLGLFVDDAHLLDDASAALVLQVAAQPWCRLVATIRSGEPAPDAIVALWKDGLADRLELSALSPADSETLIDALLTSVHGASRPVAAATVERLLERSGGNALYLRELVVGVVVAGALELDLGLWRLGGAAAAPVR
ncbi:MAG: hypothetical protein QOG64_2898, partial [Acidimicrobiaceae bacterium]|nr:hypothetical protein [Acidimicrobiaceae bacterium]